MLHRQFNVTKQSVENAENIREKSINSSDIDKNETKRRGTLQQWLIWPKI